MDKLGRYLAIDLGEKNIGIAVSDTMFMLARPLTTFQRTSRKDDIEMYKKLIAENDVILIVMGLPTYLNGTDSEQTLWVRNYTEQLAGSIDIPVVFQNEALSSQRALESMIQSGSNRKKRATQIDAVAAAHILQDYLDIHHDSPFSS